MSTSSGARAVDGPGGAPPGRADAFRRFAEAAEAARDARGSRRKTEVVARHLADLPDEALAQAAVFWTGRPFPHRDARRVRVGWSTLRDAALALTPWDARVYDACQRVVGETAETLEKLFARDPPPPAAQRRLTDDDGGPFTLADAAAAYDALARARTTADKRRVLERAWRRMSAVETKHFTKILGGGMRLGLAEPVVQEAVARATGAPGDAVRHADAVTGDLGHVALLARAGRLDEARLRPLHGLLPMLATPVEPGAAVPDLALRQVEDKYDGIRAQVHKAEGQVALYTRNLSEAKEFPELAEAARRHEGGFVLDGEVVAWRDGRASFALLQSRLGRKDVPEALRRDAPVRFVAFDLLWADGEEVFRRPLVERRRRLEALGLAEPFSVAPVHDVRDEADLARRFAEARARGNEGLLLKRVDAPYEFGRRGRGWLKMKAPLATLDVVVTAAEQGHGKRAGLLSAYTFAVQDDDGRLANVGKAFTGLTDAELARMTREFRRSTLERRGGVHLVEPRVVVEVAFDGVQRSPRHRGGYALRFPRIVRLRPDLAPEDADTLARVRELADAG